MKKPKKKIDITKIFIAVAIVFGISFVVKGLSLQPVIVTNKQKIEKINAEIEEEKRRNAELDKIIENADSDEFIEKIAREKLGMIKSNEIVFVDVSGNKNRGNF